MGGPSGKVVFVGSVAQFRPFVYVCIAFVCVCVCMCVYVCVYFVTVVEMLWTGVRVCGCGLSVIIVKECMCTMAVVLQRSSLFAEYQTFGCDFRALYEC